MDLAVAAAPAGRERLRAVRAWWRERPPGPTIGQRLDLLYTIAISAAILGALAYGTASSALAQVVTPHGWRSSGRRSRSRAADDGALGRLPRAGGVLGPRRHAPPRRAAAAERPGGRAAPIGAGGRRPRRGAHRRARDRRPRGRGPRHRDEPRGRPRRRARSARALGVAAAWAVERSARWDGLTDRAIWPAAIVAVGLALVVGRRPRRARDRALVGALGLGGPARDRGSDGGMGQQRSRSSRRSPRPRRAPRSAAPATARPSATCAAPRPARARSPGSRASTPAPPASPSAARPTTSAAPAAAEGSRA